MPDHIMRTALSLFEDYTDVISIGGGEPALRPALLSNLRTAILQQKIYPEYIFMVTNGKRLVKELENEAYDEEDYDYDIVGPVHTALRELSWICEVQLNVSTDRWHGKDAESRFNFIEDSFEYIKDITVGKQGPVNYRNLIGIGRAKGYKDYVLDLDEEMQFMERYNELYVTVDGDIFPSCNMSYEMYETLTNTSLFLGNVLTDSIEDIEVRFKHLSTFDKVVLWEGITEQEINKQFTASKISKN
jgi:hypothetical protein